MEPGQTGFVCTKPSCESHGIILRHAQFQGFLAASCLLTDYNSFLFSLSNTRVAVWSICVVHSGMVCGAANCPCAMCAFNICLYNYWRWMTCVGLQCRIVHSVSGLNGLLTLSFGFLQVVGSESGGIYTTPLHFRNSGVAEVIELLTKRHPPMPRRLHVPVTSVAAITPVAQQSIGDRY